MKWAFSAGFGKIFLAGGPAALMVMQRGLPADIFNGRKFSICVKLATKSIFEEKYFVERHKEGRERKSRNRLNNNDNYRLLIINELTIIKYDKELFKKCNIKSKKLSFCLWLISR